MRSTLSSILSAIVIAASLGASPARSQAPAPLVGDATRGKALYQSCEACHSIDANDLGPRHRGVVGRPAGQVADYAYSAALKRSGLTWDPATLDRWLTDPSALVPGTRMFFRVDDAQSRADLIAYLAELR